MVNNPIYLKFVQATIGKNNQFLNKVTKKSKSRSNIL